MKICKGFSIVREIDDFISFCFAMRKSREKCKPQSRVISISGGFGHRQIISQWLGRSFDGTNKKKEKLFTQKCIVRNLEEKGPPQHVILSFFPICIEVRCTHLVSFFQVLYEVSCCQVLIVGFFSHQEAPEAQLCAFQRHRWHL